MTATLSDIIRFALSVKKATGNLTLITFICSFANLAGGRYRFIFHGALLIRYSERSYFARMRSLPDSFSLSDAIMQTCTPIFPVKVFGLRMPSLFSISNPRRFRVVRILTIRLSGIHKPSLTFIKHNRLFWQIQLLKKTNIR